MRSTVAAVLLCLIPVSGCTPLATYPPDVGGLGLSAPSLEPIPTVMAEAIRYAHGRHGSSEEFAINLPAGTPTAVYDRVIMLIGDGHPMQDPQEYTYHVTKVRVRGRNVTVDVFYPRPEGGYQFATISFQGDLIRGFRHERTRTWQTLDEPPGPNYVAAETPDEAGQQPLASETASDPHRRH